MSSTTTYNPLGLTLFGTGSDLVPRLCLVASSILPLFLHQDRWSRMNS